MKTKSKKSLFISIIRRYNTATAREHNSYMNRGCGGKYDWYKTRNRLGLAIQKVNTEFKNAFRDMIPKDDYKTFDLGRYETFDPQEMMEVWFEETTEE